MDVRQTALYLLEGARGIAPAMGLHCCRVVVRSATWSSGKVQTGTLTVSDLVLGAPDPVTGAILPPHVRATSGDSELEVGPLTPFDAVAAPRGFTPLQLVPSDAPGVEYYYLVTLPGAAARRFVVAPRGLVTTSPLRWMVRLRADDRKVPF